MLTRSLTHFFCRLPNFLCHKLADFERFIAYRVVRAHNALFVGLFDFYSTVQKLALKKNFRVVKFRKYLEILGKAGRGRLCNLPERVEAHFYGFIFSCSIKAF